MPKSDRVPFAVSYLEETIKVLEDEINIMDEMKEEVAPVLREVRLMIYNIITKLEELLRKNS